MTQKEIAISHEMGHMLGRYIWAGNIDNVEYFTITTEGDGYTHSINKRLNKYLSEHHTLNGFVNEPDATAFFISQLMYGLGGMVMEMVCTNATDYDEQIAQGAAADLNQQQLLLVNECGLPQSEFDRLQADIFSLLYTVYSSPLWFETAQKFVKYISRQCKPNKTNKFKPTVFYAFFPRQNPNDPVEILEYFKKNRQSQ